MRPLSEVAYVHVRIIRNRYPYSLSNEIKRVRILVVLITNTWTKINLGSLNFTSSWSRMTQACCAFTTALIFAPYLSY